MARKKRNQKSIPGPHTAADAFGGGVFFLQVRKMKGLKRGRDKLVEAEREKAESAKAARGTE